MDEKEVGTGKPDLDRYIARVENYGIDKASERAATNQELAMVSFLRAYDDMAQIIYQDMLRNGFWDQPRNVGEMLMLAVSELSEGMEAWRKDLNDDHLPQYSGLTVEIADCIIRLMDTGRGLGLDIAGALIDKVVYNRTRPYKHGKKC
jgi:NTP pyrophosphatase (non-canonical NTP hydrolase)